jgi:hypothetical protein
VTSDQAATTTATKAWDRTALGTGA